MAICPFLNKECFAECALYAPGIKNCCFVASTLLLEDIQRVAVLAYEKYLQPPGAPLREISKEAPRPMAAENPEKRRA
ncbi:MAG: hypothetical protein RDV48_04175 [Candidatus Eremiobacteraeota bacterium]|nr:hypothetical protein [Candidatus Eremiobacteraeota bacterium]